MDIMFRAHPQKRDVVLAEKNGETVGKIIETGGGHFRWCLSKGRYAENWTTVYTVEEARTQLLDAVNEVSGQMPVIKRGLNSIISTT